MTDRQTEAFGGRSIKHRTRPQAPTTTLAYPRARVRPRMADSRSSRRKWSGRFLEKRARSSERLMRCSGVTASWKYEAQARGALKGHVTLSGVCIYVRFRSVLFVLTRPRHVPTARPGALMESAFVLAATIGPGPSHHPHGTLLSNRRGGGLLRLESGKVEGIYKACRQRTRPSARGLGCGDGALEVPLCLCALCVVAS